LFWGAVRAVIVAPTRGGCHQQPGRKSLPIACGMHGIPTGGVTLLTDGA
jgi:hypothetical protein